MGGLRQLELLMLHGNNIRSVSDGAFRDLGALQVISEDKYGLLRKQERADGIFSVLA